MKVRAKGDICITVTESDTSGSLDVQDEGTDLGVVDTINFVGDNVSVTKSGTVATVTVTGSSGGGGGSFTITDYTTFETAGFPTDTTKTYRLVFAAGENAGPVKVDNVYYYHNSIISYSATNADHWISWSANYGNKADSDASGSDTTPDNKQVFGFGGDSIFAGHSEAYTDTPIPGTNVLFESDGSTITACDAAYILSHVSVGRNLVSQFAIDYNSDSNKKVVAVNGALTSSRFTSTNAAFSWQTNGTLYSSFVTKLNNTLSLLGLTKPKAIFFNLGVNDDGALTLGDITSLIDRLRADFPGVPVVFTQIGEDAVFANSVFKRNLLRQAVSLYDNNVAICCNNAALYGAGEYQSDHAHPTQVGCNDQGHMFARWMKNSTYTKWTRSIVSSFFNEIGTTKKDAWEAWMTSIGTSAYLSLFMGIFFDNSDARNKFYDVTFCQEPQNPGATVGTLNDSLATNGTTYFSLFSPNGGLGVASLGDCFVAVKVKANSTPAGTLANIIGGQFGSSLIGIKQTTSNNIVFDCVDTSGLGLVYSGQTSFQANTLYATGRNGGTLIGYVNGAQVVSGSVGQLNTPSPVVLGGRNTANSFPTATLADGITASFQYLLGGKQSTAVHSTLYSATETLMGVGAS